MTKVLHHENGNQRPHRELDMFYINIIEYKTRIWYSECL